MEISFSMRLKQCCLLLIAIYVSEARLNERHAAEVDTSNNSYFKHHKNHYHHPSHHKKQNEKNDAFDFYVLSMSYQPEFCDSHKFNDFVGCKKPDDFWRGSLTLHGLWPQVRMYMCLH